MKGCICKRTDGTHSTRCLAKAPCKLCTQVAPEKCHWHGGRSHSTERGGKGRARTAVVGGASKPRAAGPSRNGPSATALVAQMDELIATKRRELDQLASARDILARA
jgi:hypothetical protein